MKTKIMLPALTVILLSVIVSRAYSQQDKEDMLAFASANTKVLQPATNYAEQSKTVRKKVIDAFTTEFGNAAEQNWTILNNNAFLNRFKVGDNIVNTLFDRNGKLVYTITYGTEKNIPAEVRKIIRSEYFDYSIITAIQVKEDNREIWVIKMDSISKQIVVRVEDREMEEVQKFNKL